MVLSKYPPFLTDSFSIFCCETKKGGGGIYLKPWQTHLQTVINLKQINVATIDNMNHPNFCSNFGYEKFH